MKDKHSSEIQEREEEISRLLLEKNLLEEEKQQMKS
jgi:hypothetical protein